MLEVGELRIDAAGRAVWAAGAPVDLTPKEFDLLHMLAAQPGRAYSGECLLQRIWGMEYDGCRTWVTWGIPGRAGWRVGGQPITRRC